MTGGKCTDCVFYDECMDRGVVCSWYEPVNHLVFDLTGISLTIFMAALVLLIG